MRLDDAKSKLARAREHLEALQKEIGAFLEANPYRIVVERPTPELHVVVVHSDAIVPYGRWSLILGDCVHNLRACLDYLAWQMAGSDPKDTSTQFPIFETSIGWRRNHKRRTARLTPKLLAFVERTQPYNASHPETTPLNILRILDDSDKHKLLTVTLATPIALHIEGISGPCAAPAAIRWTMVPNPTLEDGAILATLVFSSPSPEMEMNGKLVPIVVFGESLGFGKRIEVLPSLAVIADDVEAVLDEALACDGSHTPPPSTG
jgi:hypothetical protein